MKTKLLISAVLLTAIAGCKQPAEDAKQPADAAKDTPPAAAGQLTTEDQRVSYGMAVNLAKRIKREYAFDVEAFTLGVRDVMSDAAIKMTDEDIQKELMAFQQRQVEKHEKEQLALATTNKEASDKFFAENAGKEGVVATATGLQYKVVAAGSGDKPAATDTVKVHYRGTKIDGSEFDSSYARGEPVTFPVNGVIPGWTEALQLMPVGSKWQLFIPPDLAYGSGGTGPIGPNEALLFDVELLEIVKPGAETAAEPAPAEGSAATAPAEGGAAAAATP